MIFRYCLGVYKFEHDGNEIESILSQCKDYILSKDCGYIISPSSNIPISPKSSTEAYSRGLNGERFGFGVKRVSFNPFFITAIKGVWFH